MSTANGKTWAIAIWLRGILILLIYAGLLLPALANAHAVGQSYVFLSIFEDVVEGRVEIPIENLNQALGIGLKEDKSVVPADLEPVMPQIRTFVERSLTLWPDGRPVGFTITGHELLDLSFGQLVAVRFRTDELPGVPTTIDVEYAAIKAFDSDHRSMLVIENNWRTGTFNNEANVALTFTPDEIRQRLDLSSSSLWRGFLAMVESGMHHIAIGIDHILFILALLIPSVMRRADGHWQPVARFRDAFWNVVKVVTLFTIAHTITLSLATLEYVKLPSRLVESVIALSIILVALDIVVPLFRRKIWLVVFAFGLFHGFGFASVLSDLGIHRSYVALTLVGFNVGVEVGQLAIVLAAFPILYLFRNLPLYARIGMPYGAMALMLIAGYWFIERAFDVDLPAGALLNQVTGFFV